MSDLLERVDTNVEVVPYEEPTGEGKNFAHIINPPKNVHIWRPGMSAQVVVDIARAQGIEVVALCDYRWVPKMNPDKFDACPVCIERAGDLMRGNNE